MSENYTGHFFCKSFSLNLIDFKSLPNLLNGSVISKFYQDCIFHHLYINYASMGVRRENSRSEQRKIFLKDSNSSVQGYKEKIQLGFNLLGGVGKRPLAPQFPRDTHVCFIRGYYLFFFPIACFPDANI